MRELRQIWTKDLFIVSVPTNCALLNADHAITPKVTDYIFA